MNLLTKQTSHRHRKQTYGYWGIRVGRDKQQTGIDIHILFCCCLVAASVQFFATPGTIAYRAPLSMGFPRQEHWSGLPCPPPGELPDPGIELESPAWQVDSFTVELPGKPLYRHEYICSI